MRRILAAAALAAFAVAGAACTANGTVTASPSGSGTPNATATASPSPDPSASVICADLRTNVLDKDAREFGTDLGNMIAARAKGDTAAANTAQQAAVTKLHQISASLRSEADNATNTDVKQALDQSADNLDKLANDTDNFSKVDSLPAVSQTTQKFVEALSSITKFCSAQ
jgi:hypothetical protein